MNASRIENAGSPEFFLWGAGAITAAQASLFALDYPNPNAIHGPLLEKVHNIANERAEKIASALGTEIHNSSWRFVAIGIDESFKNCQEILRAAVSTMRSPRLLLFEYRSRLSHALAKRLEVPLVMKYPAHAIKIMAIVTRLRNEDKNTIQKLYEAQQYEYNS